MGQPGAQDQARSSQGRQPGFKALRSLRALLRQIVHELRKVIWPTRKELITYTWVVIVFVAVYRRDRGLYDLVFTRLVLQLFG